METEKLLQNRLEKVAQDMAKQAGHLMEAESYGQWTELPYQAMAEMKVPLEHMDLTAEPVQIAPALNPQIATEYTRVFAAPDNLQHASIVDAADGYYFMAGTAKAQVSQYEHASSPMPFIGKTSRIEGLDILDTDFLCGLANNMFKESMGVAGTNILSDHEREAAAYGTAPYFLSEKQGRRHKHKISGSSFDVERIRRDFPVLQRKVHGKPLIWLDNGATTQKPQVVINRVSQFYEQENSNVHRGAHVLAAESTDAYEEARGKVAAFLGAASAEEIVFVRGTTEGINLLAYVCGDKALAPGDEILLTEAEHHANIVPWQFAAQKTGAVIRVAPVDDKGEIIIEEYVRLLGERTRVVAMTHVSNVLGTVMPIHEMTRMAKRYGATVVIDGAQGVPHRRVDVQAIGCDFYVFSGHKLFGPTGIGAIYGRKELWEKMSPWQGGGNMIQHVTFEKSTFAPAPNKFEAGTGSLASAVGLGAAIDYLNSIGLEEIERYETDLLDYALDGILKVRGLRVIGMPRDRGGVISFVMKGIPDIEVGKMLDAEGIAVRAGHHCAQPVLAHFGLESSVRPAFAFYNTKSEADALIDALHRISFSR